MGEERARRIPTELEIEVLQHLASEGHIAREGRIVIENESDHACWHALVNCALVCKAWTGYARSHLYYAINVESLRGKRQFECLREYSHLRPFLREFKWPRGPLVPWVVPLYRFNPQDTDIIKNIAPTITKLRLLGVGYRFLSPPLREAISTFTNITELDMTGSLFENWTTVVRVVSSFPLLATLAMPCTSTLQDDDPDGPEISYPLPGHLVHIKLAFGCETETVRWICKGSPIPNIQTVEAESKIDSSALAKLLKSLGGSLRHLTIHIDSSRMFLISGLRRQNLL